MSLHGKTERDIITMGKLLKASKHYVPISKGGEKQLMRTGPVALAMLVGLLIIGTLHLSGFALASPSSISNLNGLVLLSPTNGWAVGDSGTILHYDGFGWSLVPSGITADLFGISFGTPGSQNPSAGFAVGGSGTGTALACCSPSWFPIAGGLTPPGAQKLQSVFELSATDAWAVDSVSGGIWHWTGSTELGGAWSLAATASAGLNSVFMTSSTDGWAVGAGGIIYHFTGGGWTPYTTEGTSLNSVFMLSGTEGWAVGNGGTVYHFSSGTWLGPLSPGSTSQDLRSVFMVSQTEGWAVGTSGAVLHYSGGSWTALPQNYLATNQNLNAVYFVGGVGLAVGDGGTTVVVQGQTVQGAPASSFQSVYLSSATDGWIVGCSSGGCGSGSGEPVLAHWNGASYTRGTVLGPAADLYSVFMVSSSEGWAVGGIGTTPVILHYVGGGWSSFPAPLSGVILRSVFMTDSNNGWAVGDNGVILRYAGGSWGSVSSQTTNTLRSVFMLGSSDGWAVGDGGTILRYQSISGLWISYPSPTSARLNSVFLSDSSHGWAVGASGTILHYDGTTWGSVAQSFASANLNSVSQLNSQNAWAVGDSGTILQWNGYGWYPAVPSPPLAGNPNLNSVFLDSSGYGLIVGGIAAPGAQGTIVTISGANPITNQYTAQTITQTTTIPYPVTLTWATTSTSLSTTHTTTQTTTIVALLVSTLTSTIAIPETSGPQLLLAIVIAAILTLFLIQRRRVAGPT